MCNNFASCVNDDDGDEQVATYLMKLFTGFILNKCLTKYDNLTDKSTMHLLTQSVKRSYHQCEFVRYVNM